MSLLSSTLPQIAVKLDNARLFEQNKQRQRQLEQEIETRTDFLRMLTHELNTPLTPILSSGKLLIEYLPPEQEIATRLARNIFAGAQTLGIRLSELMDLFKGEMGMLKVEPEILEAEKLLYEFVNQYSSMFVGKKQTFQTKIAALLPPILADRGRVAQILLNLLNNASKFTPEGEEITLRAWAEKGFLVTEIENTVPSISPEEQLNLFLPYRHSDRSQGMGLGLVICKQLVELQGGKIWYRERPGQGNIFGFSLPLASSHK